MFKLAATVLATALTAVGAFGQEVQLDSKAVREAPSAVLRYDVRADLDKARIAGAWPVRESNGVQRYTVAVVEGGHKAHRRPRKEYPNVMGMTIDEWLDSRQAIADQAEASARQQ